MLESKINNNKHPESENLYCEKIDMGDEVREIASGLQKFVPIEKMSGLVLVLANLAPVILNKFREKQLDLLQMEWFYVPVMKTKIKLSF